MNWIPLNTINQLEAIRNNTTQNCIIFKHSTRCPVSSMAKRTITYGADAIPEDVPVYYLDLIAYREVSDAIAQWWGVTHESPQLLIIKGDKAVFHASHGDIDMDELLKHLI